MDLITLRSFLAWCTVVNMSFLFVYWVAMIMAHDWIRTMHGKWFKMSDENFDEIHYKLMAYFKTGIILFNLTPYLVLRFMV